MLTQELVKIARRLIGRVKFTTQDLDHFSQNSGSGISLIIHHRISQITTYFILDQTFIQ